MKYKITKDNLAELMEEFELKPADSIQHLCIAMAQKACSEGEDPEPLFVKIQRDLLPDSYTQVAAMFARSIMGKVEYPVIQSYIKGDFLILRGADSKAPTTFKARVREALRRNQIFKADRELVPPSYRRRPSILASVLTDEIGQTVCNRCKKKRIIWYISN